MTPWPNPPRRLCPDCTVIDALADQGALILADRLHHRAHLLGAIHPSRIDQPGRRAA